MAEKSVFKLQDIKKAADQRFGKLEVELEDGSVTVLNSPVRVSDENLNVVLRIMDELKDEADEEGDEDLSAIKTTAPKMREFLLAVGDNKTPALLEEVGQDLGVVVALFEAYQEAVGLGESSASST